MLRQGFGEGAQQAGPLPQSLLPQPKGQRGSELAVVC